MLTQERISELFIAAGGSPMTFARAVEAEARREALEEGRDACACYECLDAIRALINKEPRT